MPLWVLAWLNLCLVLAQTNVVTSINGSSTLITINAGHRILWALPLSSSTALFQAGMVASFTLDNSSCTGSSSTLNVISPSDATVDEDDLTPGTYYLCINQTLQTQAPLLTIVPGTPNVTALYSCGNWTSLTAAPPFAEPFSANYQGFAILPNVNFPVVTGCSLLFLCSFCQIVASIGGVNLTINLPSNSSFAQPDLISYTSAIVMSTTQDQVVRVWSQGAGSNATLTTNFTMRLLAPVTYENNQGAMAGCSRQSRDLDLAVKFGRDLPPDAGILIFFPKGTALTSVRVKPNVEFGFNINWDYVVQAAETPDYVIIPLLGNSSNQVIPAGSQVIIQFPTGTFLAPTYNPLSKIIVGAYHPLLPNPGAPSSLIPIEYAVNVMDTNANTSTFSTPWLARDPVYTTPIQSTFCDSVWSLTFYMPRTTNHAHILVSLTSGGPMQFAAGASSLPPVGFRTVSSPTSQELTYFTDPNYQQLIDYNTTINTCQNLTFRYLDNATSCATEQTIGGTVTNVTLLLFEQGVLVATIPGGIVYVASPAPTAPPTPPTNQPTKAPSMRNVAPCPTASVDFARMTSGQPNAPLCEVECNVSNIRLDPPLDNSSEVLCGLADPVSVFVPGIRQEDAPPPEPSGIRATQVMNIVLVNSSGDVVPVPNKIEFTLPFLSGDSTIQRAVYSTKNYKYAYLSCEYYDRSTLSWSTAGCQLVARDLRMAALGGKHGVCCVCTHTTEFAVIVRNVPCTAEYAEWGFGVAYCLLTFFALIQAARVSMHAQSKPGGSCDTLLIHHILLVIVGVLRAVGMFARCSMSLEVRVLLASIPYAILLLQYLLVVLVWSSVALFAVEDSPMRYLKWVFVIGSVFTIMFTLALPGIVFFDLNQYERSTLAVYMSYAFGALDCAMALAGVVAGLRLACRLHANKGNVSNEGLVRKFVWLAISIGVLFVAEAALWGVSVDEYSLATFEVIDAVYRGCDVLSFVLLLSMFLDSVNQRSRSAAPAATRSSRNIKSSRQGRSVEISSKASISRE